VRLLISIVALTAATAVAAQPDEAAKRYNKLVHERVERAWAATVDAYRNEIPVGSLHVLCDVSPQGRLLHLRVTSNTSNHLFATLCADIIRQTKFPPTPPTLGKNGVYFFDLKFTMLD
jgi:hypothetical protein